MTIIKTLLKSTTRFNTGLPTDFLVLNTVLAFLSGLISVAAFSQLIRIHVREKFWTRQKVLHFLLGSSNLGYFIYFVSAHFATCRKWFCWSHLCGFVLMAYPKILFLAAFLLILSFWVDLCHQARDEEEDDEGNSTQQALLEKSMNELNSTDANRHRGCCSFQGLNFRRRQKSAMVVVALLFIVMISFGLIILIGARKNSEDAFSAARVYEDIISIASLFIGGALGCYGLLLYLKLKKIRSDIASSEMWKVSSLAVSSFVCFTASSLVAILTDITLHYHWHPKKHGAKPVIFMIMCYLLGSLAPSAVVLWITRELPAEITIRWKESRIITFIRRNS